MAHAIKHSATNAFPKQFVVPFQVGAAEGRSPEAAPSFCCSIGFQGRVFSLSNLFRLSCIFLINNVFLRLFVFLNTNFYLIKVKIRTDIDDRPYSIHGKVNDMSRFLIPDLL